LWDGRIDQSTYLTHAKDFEKSPKREDEESREKGKGSKKSRDMVPLKSERRTT